MGRRNEVLTVIGVYDGKYCGSFYIEIPLRCMGLSYKVFGDSDIDGPHFSDEFSVLVFGAGHVSGSAAAWGGTTGRQRIRESVREGRTYIGICAGAYLALFDEPKGLALAQHTLDRPQAGDIFQGFLGVEWLREPATVFPAWYQNGPVFSHGIDGAIARFAANRTSTPSPVASSASLGPPDFEHRPAVVETQHGRGRCVLLSPHLELGSLGIPGCRRLLGTWMAKRFPQEHKAHPNRLPVGRARSEFFEGIPALGLERETNGPQWSMLRKLLKGGSKHREAEQLHGGDA